MLGVALSVRVGSQAMEGVWEKAVDVSLASQPKARGEEHVRAFYLPSPRSEAFEGGGFVGDVDRGGSCNCEVRGAGCAGVGGRARVMLRDKLRRCCTWRCTGPARTRSVRRTCFLAGGRCGSVEWARC